MAEAAKDFTSILIRNKALGRDQLDEAIRLAQSTGIKLQDALIKLTYSTQAEVMSAIAEFHNLQFVDLANIEIPKTVIELVPESVARENVVLPLVSRRQRPQDYYRRPDQLRHRSKINSSFLIKTLQPVLADHEQIREAINRHYGQTETESVDSMLVEFTDTAIEFTQTENDRQPGRGR